jgi:hypothetical protein
MIRKSKKETRIRLHNHDISIVTGGGGASALAGIVHGTAVCLKRNIPNEKFYFSVLKHFKLFSQIKLFATDPFIPQTVHAVSLWNTPHLPKYVVRGFFTPQPLSKIKITMYCTVILLRAKALAGVCLTDWVVLSSKFA